MFRKVLYFAAFIFFLIGIYFALRTEKSQPAPEIGTFCTMDAKVCSDGTSFGRNTPDCDFPPCPGEKEGILVSLPKINQGLQSPLLIQGEARGPWFFEAQFNAEILDENGNLLGTAVLTAIGDWMTEDFVPFEGTMEFEVPGDFLGTLRFKSANPSGLPENQKKYDMKVIFSD